MLPEGVCFKKFTWECYVKIFICFKTKIFDEFSLVVEKFSYSFSSFAYREPDQIYFMLCILNQMDFPELVIGDYFRVDLIEKGLSRFHYSRLLSSAAWVRYWKYSPSFWVPRLLSAFDLQGEGFTLPVVRHHPSRFSLFPAFTASAVLFCLFRRLLYKFPFSVRLSPSGTGYLWEISEVFLAQDLELPVLSWCPFASFSGSVLVGCILSSIYPESGVYWYSMFSSLFFVWPTYSISHSCEVLSILGWIFADDFFDL